MKEFLRTLKYALVAASAGIIKIGSFTLFNEVIKMEYYLAYIISLALSVVWNLTINRKATFKSDANYGIAMIKVIGYYLVFAPLTMWGGQELVNVGWNEYLVEGLTMLLNFVTEYLFFMFVVFRGKIDNAEKKTEEATEENV